MTINNPTLCENNLANWPDMTDQQGTDMPSRGASPWGNNWPPEVWCWDEEADEVLVGTCPDDARIISYAEAVRPA